MKKCYEAVILVATLFVCTPNVLSYQTFVTIGFQSQGNVTINQAKLWAVINEGIRDGIHVVHSTGPTCIFIYDPRFRSTVFITTIVIDISNLTDAERNNVTALIEDDINNALRNNGSELHAVVTDDCWPLTPLLTFVPSAQCTQTVNLCSIIDGFGSIDDLNEKATFISRIAESLDRRAGLAILSNLNTEWMSDPNITRIQEVPNADVQFIGTTTDLTEALLDNCMQIFNVTTDERQKVRNVTLIVIEQQHYQLNFEEAFQQAERLHDTGIFIVVVGSSTDDNITSLMNASPYAYHYVDDFWYQFLIRGRVLENICQSVEVPEWIPPHPPLPPLPPPCPIGYYRADFTEPCAKCPAGQTTQNTSATSLSDCYSDTPYKCEEKIDLCLIIDSSGSIRDNNPPDGSYDNWKMQLDFVFSIVEGFTIRRDETRVGAVLFSTDADKLFDLLEANSLELIEAALHFEKLTSYVGQFTNHKAALLVTRTEIFNVTAGDRENIPNIAIIITDGVPTLSIAETPLQAQKLREAGAQIFVVGVGRGVDEHFATLVASSPDMYVLVEDFLHLPEIRNQVVMEICQSAQSNTIPSTTSTSGASSTFAAPNTTSGSSTSSPSTEDDDNAPNNVVPAVVAVVCVVVVLLLVALFIFLCMRRRRMKIERSRSKVWHEIKIKDTQLILLTKDLGPDLKHEVEDCWINPHRITTGHLLGTGNYGLVWSGELQSDKSQVKIAIKKIKGRSTPEVTEEFLREALVMRMFNHPNVLSLLGVSVHEDVPCVVLPFMSNGDLKTYLRKHQADFELKDMLRCALGAAKGMEHLAQQKFVHRDLAARNCMLDSNLVLKVSDFGLTRDVYEKDYYKIEDKSRGLPIRWMAIESITQSRFSVQSDVWSYGILLWEIFTKGGHPYQGLDNLDIEGFLEKGRRLAKPDMAANYIYDIMRDCWNENPDERPSFSDIVIKLSKYLELEADYLGVVDDCVDDEGYLNPVQQGNEYTEEPHLKIELQRQEEGDGYLSPVKPHGDIGTPDIFEDQVTYV